MTVETWNEFVRDVRLTTKPKVQFGLPLFAEPLYRAKETSY